MKYYLIAWCLLLSGKTMAQRLIPGDKLPLIHLDSIINYSKASAELQEFNTKPLLIQFWGTGCAVSVASLNKLDSLKQRFAGKLDILLVTSDPAIDIRPILAKKRVSLPCVVGDTLMRNKYFPYMSIPHELWIGADGLVKAITGYEELTIPNIELLVKGQPLKLKEKRDATTGGEYWVIDPLISYNYDRYKGDILYYSFLTGPRDGISYSARYPGGKDSIKRIKLINTPLKHLYQVAHNKWADHSSLVVLLTSKAVDTLQEYCYDMILKTRSMDSFFSRMRNDLDRHFGTTSHIEKRQVPCYVLHIDSAKGITPSRYKQYEKIEHEGETEHRGFRFSAINNYLDRQPIPFINEISYTNKIDITLPSDLTNIELLRHHLAKVGLKLIKEERLLEVVVIE